MPALQIRMSRLEVCEVIWRAAECTEESEVWSQGMKVNVVVGLMVLPVVMTDSLALVLRPVKKIWEGRCWARVWIVCAPRPDVPGSGQSVVGEGWMGM